MNRNIVENEETIQQVAAPKATTWISNTHLLHNHHGQVSGPYGHRGSEENNLHQIPSRAEAPTVEGPQGLSVRFSCWGRDYFEGSFVCYPNSC
jgi:hypothetical protein